MTVAIRSFLFRIFTWQHEVGLIISSLFRLSDGTYEVCFGQVEVCVNGIRCDA